MVALDRRTIIAFFATISGVAGTLLPDVLWAQIQPGTRKLTTGDGARSGAPRGPQLDGPGVPGAARFAVEFLAPR